MTNRNENPYTMTAAEYEAFEQDMTALASDFGIPSDIDIDAMFGQYMEKMEA